MRRTLALLCAAGLLQTARGAPQRSRGEGLPGVEASNTIGLGHVWVAIGSEALFQVDPVAREGLLGQVDTSFRGDLSSLMGSGVPVSRTLRLLPRVQGSLGLAHFLEFRLESVPWDGQKLGRSTAWIKCTTPGNDNLRVFGVAGAFGATLSTEEDVYSRDASTPGFEPLFHVLAVADVDLLRLSIAYPVKLYLNYANFEDERLVHAYRQHKFQAAAEWKGFRGGAYVRLATHLYRRLSTRFDTLPGDRWKPVFHEATVGYRWMKGDRFTFTAEFSLDPLSPLAFYRDEARKPPRLSAEVSVPLLAQETQSEALRSLLFTEDQRRRARVEAAARKPGSDSTAKTAQGLPSDLDALSLGRGRKDAQEGELLRNVLGDQEKEIKERRSKIRAELKEIEELLE